MAGRALARPRVHDAGFQSRADRLRATAERADAYVPPPRIPLPPRPIPAPAGIAMGQPVDVRGHHRRDGSAESSGSQEGDHQGARTSLGDAVCAQPESEGRAGAAATGAGRGSHHAAGAACMRNRPGERAAPQRAAERRASAQQHPRRHLRLRPSRFPLLAGAAGGRATSEPERLDVDVRSIRVIRRTVPAHRARQRRPPPARSQAAASFSATSARPRRAR